MNTDHMTLTEIIRTTVLPVRVVEALDRLADMEASIRAMTEQHDRITEALSEQNTFACDLVADIRKSARNSRSPLAKQILQLIDNSSFEV